MIRMFALVLVVSVVGCSGSTGGIGGGNVPKEQYNSEVYKAICSHFATCGIAKSADTCFKYYQTLLGAYASVGTNLYDKAIELGKIKYDGAAAARCLSGYSNSACSLSALIVPAADCRSVYVGQVPVGSACGYGQCVPSAFCSSEVDAKCPGTCKARVEAGGTATSPAECVYGLVVISGTCSQPPQEGSSCSTPGPFGSCAPGLTCSADTKTCVKPKIAGDTCSTSAPCDIFYTCVSGKCTAPGDVGASCGQATAAGLGCKIELHCNNSGTSGGTCAQRLGEGNTCIGSECNFDLRCSKASATATDKTCHKPTPLNGPCTTATASDCATGLYCSSSSQTCVNQLAEGTTCTSSDVCNFGTCTSGKCVSYLSSICI